MSSARETAKPFSLSYLYPDEAEIARLVVGPNRAKAWSGLAVVLERSGLPRVDPMMGGRYWLAVRAFFDRWHHVEPDASVHSDRRSPTLRKRMGQALNRVR